MGERGGKGGWGEGEFDGKFSVLKSSKDEERGVSKGDVLHIY